MERQDFWLKVKCNYILFIGKILDFLLKYLGLKLIEVQNVEFQLILAIFDASQTMGYTGKSR